MINRLWKGHYPMKVIALVFVFLLTLELPSLAVGESDLSPLETVTTFFADWNMGEIRAASKLFDQEPSVTDAFPRFHWQGKKAFRETVFGPLIFITKARDSQATTSRLVHR